MQGCDFSCNLSPHTCPVTQVRMGNMAAMQHELRQLHRKTVTYVDGSGVSEDFRVL